MDDCFRIIINTISSNSFIMAFVVVGIITLLSEYIAKKVIRGHIASSAIAIFGGLILSYIGGTIAGGDKGISDVSLFAGMGLLGGTSIRDFVIISTAFGAEISEIKKCGLWGIVALFVGIILSYCTGAVVAYLFGYRDVASVATIAAGAVTFVVGPVTGATVGAESSVIAISIVAGLVKSVAVMLLTPLVAKKIGLTTPRSAIIFGGLIGSVSGTTAGLTATDPSLVPYGAMTASFYTGLGCILCPSLLYGLTAVLLPV